MFVCIGVCLVDFLSVTEVKRMILRFHCLWRKEAFNSDSCVHTLHLLSFREYVMGLSHLWDLRVEAKEYSEGIVSLRMGELVKLNV